MKYTAAYFIIIIDFVILLSCSNYDSTKLIIYLYPRNRLIHGVGSNSLLSPTDSIQYVSFVDREYECIIKKDSLINFLKIEMKLKKQEYKELFSNIFELGEKFDTNFSPPSIAIIRIYNSSKDTIFINSNLILDAQGKNYRLGDKFYSFLLSIMPVELRQNWEYNLPARNKIFFYPYAKPKKT